MTDKLTPQEQQYFDTQGEAPTEAPAEEAPAADEADLVLEQPAEAPAEEAPAEDHPDRDKRVPLAALHEARAKAKEYQAQLEEFRLARVKDEQKWAVAQARMDTLAAMLAPKQQEQAPPSFDEDPVAASRFGIERTGQAVMTLAQQVEDMKREKYEAQQEQAYQQHAVAAENALRQQTPDYDNAVEFLVRQRAGELAALGLQNDAVMQTLHLERRQLLQTAAQNKQNPAAMLYAVAKARGYAPKPPAADGQQKMETLAAGQRAASGVASVSGRQQTPVSIQALAEMDESDFYKISSNEKAWRKLFGE